MQRVNRVYASPNEQYGTIYKRKNGKDVVSEIKEYDNDTEKSDKIADLPEHCIIDNEFNLTINDIDKQFYIDVALKRVKEYVKNTEVSKMAETKTTKSAKTLNIFQKLSKARLEFQSAGVKKTGINRHAQYKYFELTDIVPPATKILNDNGLLFVTTFPEGIPTGTLYDMDSDATLVFHSDKDDEHLITTGGKTLMLSIQETGAKETYQRRYLYMQLLDIVEIDAIDNGIDEDEPTNKSKKTSSGKKSSKPATQAEREEIKKDLINADGEATETQIKSIKNGLKKLRDKDSDNEPYLKECMKAIKKGLTKKDAEAMLIEIGEKIEA